MPTIDFSQGVEVISGAMEQSSFLAASTTQKEGRQEVLGAEFRLQESGGLVPANLHFGRRLVIHQNYQNAAAKH